MTSGVTRRTYVREGFMPQPWRMPLLPVYSGQGFWCLVTVRHALMFISHRLFLSRFFTLYWKCLRCCSSMLYNGLLFHASGHFPKHTITEVGLRSLPRGCCLRQTDDPGKVASGFDGTCCHIDPHKISLLSILASAMSGVRVLLVDSCSATSGLLVNNRTSKVGVSWSTQYAVPSFARAGGLAHVGAFFLSGVREHDPILAPNVVEAVVCDTMVMTMPSVVVLVPKTWRCTVLWCPR